MWTYLFMSVILLVMGFAVHVLKWNMLIAGYNTMPKEKKKNVDTKGLSKFLGLFAYISAAYFFCLAALEFLGIPVPASPVIFIFIVWTMYVLFTAQKYDGNTKRGQKHLKDKKRESK